MTPIRIHGAIVPTIEDSFSPMAVTMTGQMMMRGLQCPFNWQDVSIRMFDDEDIDLMIDRLPLAAGPWDSTIRKCHLAFVEFNRGNIRESSKYLTDSYIPLMEVPGLEADCELIKTYRLGLKHVLDATSAFIRLHDAHEDSSRRLLFSFVANIPSFESMDNKQKAAIHAIHCNMSGYPTNKPHARAAIALDPTEGQWHYYLSKVIYDGEQSGPEIGREPQDMADLLNHNKIALLCSKIKGPEPSLLMAFLILTYGHPMCPETEKINELIRRALDNYPNNAYVYEQAADLLQRCNPIIGPASCDMSEKIEFFYREALRIAGKDVLSLRHKLGLQQVLRAEKIPPPVNYAELRAEGLEHLKSARFLTTETSLHYALAFQKQLTFAALGIYPPCMMDCHEEDYYDDDDDDDDDNYEYKESSSSGSSSSKVPKKTKKPKKKNKRRR